ncbi:MAG: hypothetical protein V4441_00230 [Pseudomonadota bacterium]
MRTFLTSRKLLKSTAMAAALVAAASMATVPAYAGGRHGGGGGWGGGGYSHHGGGYSHHGGGGYRGGHDNNDGLAAVALIGGLVLGAAFMSAATQPAYQQPVYQQPTYAPAPAYGSSYGSPYGYEQPLQAVPTSDVYQAQSGQYCREYQSQANIGGRMTYGYGTACQQPDGSWRVVN